MVEVSFSFGIQHYEDITVGKNRMFLSKRIGYRTRVPLYTPMHLSFRVLYGFLFAVKVCLASLVYAQFIYILLPD